jgi:hypothetical protein
MNDLRKAAETALKALEDIFGKEKVDVGAINALRQALDLQSASTKLDTTAGVLHKEWVGLTDEDFYKKDDETVFVLGMKFAEARLREKNSGN